MGKGLEEEAVRFLGLWVDDTLKYSLHISKLKAKINKGLYSLVSAKDNSPLRVRLNIYRALIESDLRFACATFGSTSRAHLEELLILQKKAIRHVTKSYYLAHADPLFLRLGILKIEDLITLERALQVFSFKQNKLPKSFHRSYFEPICKEDLNRRDDPSCIKSPELLNKHLSRSQHLMTIEAWNNVPYHIKLIPKKWEFKNALTKHLLSQYITFCTKPNCESCIFNYEDSST